MKPSRLRVLHLVNGEHFAGAERVQDLLALRLPALGVDVSFAAVKLGRFAAARQSRVPLWSIPMRGRFDLAAARRVARLVRSGDHVLVHTHTPRTALIGALATVLAGVPMVHHLHSPTWRDTRRVAVDLRNALVERVSLTRASAIMAVSTSLMAYGRRIGVPGARLRLVPNGVSTMGPLPDRARPHDDWLLGTVGLFRPRKGIEILVDALAALRARGYRCRLRLVGAFASPGYESAIRDQIAALGLAEAVEVTDFTREVHEQLADLDLFVLPSRGGEGSPMALLEAMASGVPVVATCLGGPSEALGHGRYGLLVPPGRADALATAIERVVRGDEDWAALRQRAHGHQSQHLSDLHMASQVDAVYREVLAR